MVTLLGIDPAERQKRHILLADGGETMSIKGEAPILTCQQLFVMSGEHQRWTTSLALCQKYE